MSKTHLEFILSESSFTATLINEETITHLGSVTFQVYSKNRKVQNYKTNRTKKGYSTEYPF